VTPCADAASWLSLAVEARRERELSLPPRKRECGEMCGCVDGMDGWNWVKT
jgi:hypothetical protein